MAERSYLSIGQVLDLLKQEFPDLTISKIRFLESQGLLDPERTPSGYRKFYEPDIDRLRFILRAQTEHYLPLKVIKGRLGGEDGEGGDFGGDAVYETHGGVDTPVFSGAALAEASRGGATSGEASRVEAALAGATVQRGLSGAGPETPGPAPGGSSTATGLDAAAAGQATARLELVVPGPGDNSLRGGAAGAGSGGGRSGAGGPARGATAARNAATSHPAGTPGPIKPSPGAVSGVVGAGTATASDVHSEGGHAGAHEREADGGATDAGAMADNDANVSLTLDELAAASGLSHAEVTELERFGMVAGRRIAGTTYYDGDCLEIASVAAGFRRYGVEARHLRMYKTAVEREAGFFEQVVTPMLKQRNPQARRQAVDTLLQLSRLGNQLRAAALRQALREYTGGS